MSSPSPSTQTVQHVRSILDLTFFQKFAVASGHFVNDITASIWFSYYLMYIQEVAGLSPQYGAGLMLLGQIVDAVSTPAVGYWADRGWGRWSCCGLGRLKGWHLMGVVMAVFSFPLIFSPPFAYQGDNQLIIIAYYVPFVIIYEVSWAAVQISHLAIIPKMNPDMLVRTEILSIRYILMVIANVINFLVTWYSVGMSSDCKITKHDAPVFQHLAFIALAIGVASALFFYAFTKEHGDHAVRDAVTEWHRRADGTEISNVNEESPLLVNPVPIKRNMSLSTKHLNPGMSHMTSRDWIRMPQFYMVALVYIPGRLIINVPQAFLPLYLQKSLHLPCSTIAMVPLTYFLSGFFVSMWMKMLARTVGKQLSFGVGIVLNVIGCGIIWFGNWDEDGFLKDFGVYIVFALLGGGAASGMVTGLSITADMIGVNVESSAFVYGFMSFCDKFTCGIAIMVITLLGPAVKADPTKIAEFYKTVMIWATLGCSIMAVLGLLLITVLILIKNIRRKEEFTEFHDDN